MVEFRLKKEQGDDGAKETASGGGAGWSPDHLPNLWIGPKMLGRLPKAEQPLWGGVIAA